ncbi:hypothetical protein Tco_0886471 [Tanacetum coccineum]
MTSFRLLHSFLQVLSYDESKSRRVSERAFMTLFGQDNETFTSTMFLNLDQLQRQLDKDEFQEDKSMAAFWVIDNQFQKFIDWQYFVDYDSQMTEMLFAEYTGINVTQFKETLLQHMGNVKKFVVERACHQRQYERRVNNRLMQMQESKIDSGSALDVVSSQALDANLVVKDNDYLKDGKVRYSIPRSLQSWRDLPMDNPLVSVEVFRFRGIETSKGEGVVTLKEHPSDTYVFTMKMEILLEPTSNKLMVGTDNQEKDEKQSQNDKTGLGMEKTVKDKAKSKPESQSSQKVNRKVNWSKSKSTQVNPGAKVQEI